MSASLQSRGPRDRQAGSSTGAGPREVLILRLRPEPDQRELEDRRVTWESGVKENKTQRSSKACCVFHRKRLFGESSSSDSSSCSDVEEAAPHDHSHHHGEGGCCGHTPTSSGAEGAGPAKKKRHPRPKCTKESCRCGTRFS